MLHSSVSRLVVVLALTAVVGIGVGLVAVGLRPGSVSDAQETPRPAAATASFSPATPAVPAITAAPAHTSGLTLDQAKVIAVNAFPGRVVEVKPDDDDLMGLVYDVTVLHDDGTVTEVGVAATGQIVSTDQRDHWDGTETADGTDIDQQ